MNKVLSLALLGGGIVLIVYGANASNSVASGASRMFTGAPTNKTLWLLIAGGILGLVGLVGLLRRSNTP